MSFDSAAEEHQHYIQLRCAVDGLDYDAWRDVAKRLSSECLVGEDDIWKHISYAVSRGDEPQAWMKELDTAHLFSESELWTPDNVIRQQIVKLTGEMSA